MYNASSELSVTSQLPSNYASGDFYNYEHWWPQIQPIVREYYPVYYGNWNEKNKTEQAFRVVQQLITKKFLDLKTVKDFIEAVNIISECL